MSKSEIQVPLKNGLNQLALWFERQKRVLPWRSEPTIYRVWISEIMLQQTQVATVIPYFERFIGRFPSLESLAQAPLEEVLLHWAGLGYYSRAKNLHQAARQMFECGGFPKTREEWLEIPGVGPYTAGAILSIALDQPEAILDGNVERVLSRVARIGREVKGDKKKLWDLSKKFVTGGYSLKIRPSILNQAMMELGATVCHPKNPRCEVCPFRPMCKGFQKGDAESFPPQRVRAKTISISEEVHCVLNGKGQVLLKKIPEGKWRGGLWDLLNQKPSTRKFGSLKKTVVIETKHVVTNHKIKRVNHVWQCGSTTGDLIQGESRWVTLVNPEVPVGSPVKKLVEIILSSNP